MSCTNAHHKTERRRRTAVAPQNLPLKQQILRLRARGLSDAEIGARPEMRMTASQVQEIARS